jgi:hypothetical protein
VNSIDRGTVNNLPNHFLAAEVLELGESLFEIALEAGNCPSSPAEESEAYPIEELRAATNEFFTALRLLLSIEQ